MPEPIIQVTCFCKGTNAVCTLCGGTGKVSKIGCVRCNGTGFNAGIQAAGKCYDCRGLGYRDIDNSILTDAKNDRVFE